jgi:hypothetical protein
MSVSDPQTRSLSETAASRGPNRPLFTKGGPPNYVQNGLAAASEPFKGITTDGTLVSGLFPLRRTGVSTQPLREAAGDFIGSLNPDQRAKCLFPIDTVEWRKWSNIHPTLIRHGIALFQMSNAQRDHAFALLRESLSAQGFETALNIMHLNETVMEMTGKLDEFGEDLYWLSLMGTPSATEPWGWQIDGHHLIINCFVLGDQVVMTPTFLGSEPVHAKVGKYTGTRVFEAERNHGLSVVRALAGEQRSKAVVSPDLPRDVFTSAFRDNVELKYSGIRYDEMANAQREPLLRLIELHVGRMRTDHARVKMAEVHRHLSQTYFTWMGGMEDDSVFYYRVQSPVTIIELDHQKGQAFPQYKEPYRDHIHVVMRTPNGNDYGKDLLRQHYAQSHCARG